MGVMIFIITLTTMFRLANCLEAFFEFDLPSAITTIANATTQFIMRAVDSDPEWKTPTADDTIKKLKWGLFSFMATLLTSMRRVEDMRPNVEMGPGVFKPDIPKYPPNYFVSRLKTLIKIKQEEEERNKPLNTL